MKKYLTFLFGICLLFLAGCHKADSKNMREMNGVVSDTASSSSLENMVKTSMKLKINKREVPIVWEDNKAAEALFARVKDKPIQIQTQRYGRFEQIGKLPFQLDQKDEHQVANPGDIMLYQGNYFVVFFGEHSWTYTKLGSIQNFSSNKAGQLLDQPETQIEITIDD